MQAWAQRCREKSRRHSDRASRGRSHGTTYSNGFKLLMLVICVYKYQTDFTERTWPEGPRPSAHSSLTLQDVNTSSSSRCVSVCECMLLPAEGGLRGALSQSIDHGAVAGDPLPLVSGSETNTALFLFPPPMIDI